MFSSASDAIPDRNGRVVIPQKLLEYGSIDREVVVAGVMNKIEIWNPQRWDEEQAQATEDPEAMVEQLADLGIL
jgi:MraZ protein